MGVFTGLRVVELNPDRVGAQVGQMFADFGADVIQVEPVGGLDMRADAAYPFWARGKRSIVLDLASTTDRDTLRNLLRHADVFVETNTPGTLDALGLGYDEIAAINPRLIYTSVSALGSRGAYANMPVDENLVMAKIGGFKLFERMTSSEDPPFVNTSFAGFPTSQVALHGIFAALIDRLRTGAGQHVSTSMIKGYQTLDTWTLMTYWVNSLYPDALKATPAYDEKGAPSSPIQLMLLIALTHDGRWMQFACVAPRLFQAMMRALELDWIFTDPEWGGMPGPDKPDKLMELWELMLTAVNKKTLAEWTEVFDKDPDVFAEQFRNGPVALEHPQLLHDGFTVTVTDTERGQVRQPGAIVKAQRTPAEIGRSAPTLDEHRADILSLAASAPADGGPVQSTARLPLEGITILEIATQFAAPHGATMLTDLGATVYKLEPLVGDQIRSLTGFPEVGGSKVMQGKKCIAIDMNTDEGVAIVKEMASKVDVILQGYRAGAMARKGLDYASVVKTNPNVIYVNAPGYGVDGPYGAKPAYAPSIGAAIGMQIANVGATVPERPGLSMEETKTAARRLSAAGAMSNAQADGFAATGVATAILFGIVARELGHGGQQLFSSMVNTGCHAMSHRNVTYTGAPAAPTTDDELRGTSSLRRIYNTKSGYVVVSAVSDRKWAALAAALAKYDGGVNDPGFATRVERRDNDKLVDVLSRIFVTKSAAEWEAELAPQGIAVAELWMKSIEELALTDDKGKSMDLIEMVSHPTFDESPRWKPFVELSRSLTISPSGALLGEHTDEILATFGKSSEEIAALRDSGIVA